MPRDPSDIPLISAPGRGTTAEKTPHPERRLSLRYPFIAAVEVTELRTEVCVPGQTSDLGLDGCYVDILTPLPVGSAVRIRIDRELQLFEAAATVVFAHQSMGMGLAFTETKPEYKRVLRAWIEELSGKQLPEHEIAGSEPEAGLFSAILSDRQVLNELIHLLVRKNIIHEDEGAALLRQLFR
jgi:PilZ domain